MSNMGRVKRRVFRRLTCQPLPKTLQLTMTTWHARILPKCRRWVGVFVDKRGERLEVRRGPLRGRDKKVPTELSLVHPTPWAPMYTTTIMALMRDLGSHRLLQLRFQTNKC
jgi:hypothetical protein